MAGDVFRQLELSRKWTGGSALSSRGSRRAPSRPVCSGCRVKEARYGFRDAGDDPTLDRPRTLCFECFRIELDRRQAAAAPADHAGQARLPLSATLETLGRRRRQAQIAARHALEGGRSKEEARSKRLASA